MIFLLLFFYNSEKGQYKYDTLREKNLRRLSSTHAHDTRADFYDDLVMPGDLAAAHRANDERR